MGLTLVKDLPDGQHYTVAEVAQMLHISKATVYRAIDAGDIGYKDYARDGATKRVIRIPAEQVEQYSASHYVPPRVSRVAS